MNVYTRFFRVTQGPVVEAAKECLDIAEAARASYSEILKDIGAKDRYYGDAGSSKLLALSFEERPDTNLYKRMKNGGWYPKLNTKEGRELHKRLEAVVTRSPDDLLPMMGLSNGPTVFERGSVRDHARGRVYFATATIVPYDEPVVLVQVPWYDEDPSKLKSYADNPNWQDSNLDAILWEPAKEMVELKEWEIMKEIEAFNNDQG